ncbi:hypothetical protein DFH07DRAFT_784649 [Mycena maculata]|uniref:Uncharacterized protein n=1 Tax=Mycena maculata TaxID=230809 RepID=A0AAD7HFC3_9AGAR|nr:hypothetical protein DFH07DRAFT_784649 [Mycena maculata]
MFRRRRTSNVQLEAEATCRRHRRGQQYRGAQETYGRVLAAHLNHDSKSDLRPPWMILITDKDHHVARARPVLRQGLSHLPLLEGLPPHMVHPPLIGDSEGRYRVQVVGNCGEPCIVLLLKVEFTSFAREARARRVVSDSHTLAAGQILFACPEHARLGKETNEQFRANVERALADAPDGWVVDGNYGRRIGTIVGDRATDVIWLDPPFALYFPRIIIRTFLRLFGLAEPCSPGCPEGFRVFFSGENMIWRCLTHHGTVRHREGARMAQIGLGVGVNVDEQRMRRIGGWGRQLHGWLNNVRRMAQSS